jgi:hypothetical protein
MAETYVWMAQVSARDGAELLQRYEDGVLPLLVEHGATIERRLRSTDGCTEIHVLSFPSREALGRYRGDARRVALHDLLERSGAQLELHHVHDVATG